jgi:hypothetical protein
MTAPVRPPQLDREEYIEQGYFFRILRERLANGMATQDVLERIDQEILSTTRLPFAIQFLAAELKHTGLLSSGFVRLPHYFTAYQAFILQATEDEALRFSADSGLLVLQREAEYRAGTPTPAGLFVYQFEVLCRNRLGYDEGLDHMARDPLFNADWAAYLDMIRRQIGLVDFGELVYVRSDFYVQDQRRQNPAYEPPVPPLFGEKEGKIARANRGRDPLYLFAALQRQLGYPEVPRPRPKDDPAAKFEALQNRVRDLENRLKLLEGETRGQIDLTNLGRPDLLRDDPEIEM